MSPYYIPQKTSGLPWYKLCPSDKATDRQKSGGILAASLALSGGAETWLPLEQIVKLISYS